MLCCGGYGMMCLLVIFMWFCFRCYVPKTSDSPTVRQSDICTCMGWKRPTVRHQLSGPTKELQPSVQRLGLEGQVVKSCKDVSMVKPILPKLSHFFFISGRPSLDPLDQNSIGPLDHGLCWSSWSWTLLVLLIYPFKVQNDEATLLEDDVIFITWEVHGSMNGTMNARWTRAQHKQRTISVHPWRNAMHSSKNWSSAMVAHNLFKRPTNLKSFSQPKPCLHPHFVQRFQGFIIGVAQALRKVDLPLHVHCGLGQAKPECSKNAGGRVESSSQDTARWRNSVCWTKEPFCHLRTSAVLWIEMKSND